jgi:MFS family permease
MTHASKQADPVTDIRADTKPATGMKRVAMASAVGTLIEFYDFTIYSTAAALVFAHVFFPALGSVAGSVASYATLGVAFLSRPIGSLLFGHFGDRLGRKRTLLATMSLMGGSTVLIGLLPTSGTIGIAAPIILVVLRICQGVSTGGEWAGAALFSFEHAPKNRGGFWAMFANLGGAFASILALGTFLITGSYMSDTDFVSWGWRIPFLASVVLFIVGLYIRLRTEETPDFNAATTRRRPAATLPFKEAFARQWKEILLGAGALVMPISLCYVGLAFLTSYGTAALHLPRPWVLGAVMLGNVFNLIAIVLGGMLTDRFGGRRTMIIANIVGIPWALALFPILGTKSLPIFWVAMAVTFFIAGIGFGVAGGFLSQLFPTRYRYTAIGISYSISGVLGGAVPPLVAAGLVASYGGLVFGLFLAFYSLVGLLCTLAVREHRDPEITEVPLLQTESVG